MITINRQPDLSSLVRETMDKESLKWFNDEILRLADQRRELDYIQKIIQARTVYHHLYLSGGFWK